MRRFYGVVCYYISLNIYIYIYILLCIFMLYVGSCSEGVGYKISPIEMVGLSVCLSVCLSVFCAVTQRCQLYAFIGRRLR